MIWRNPLAFAGLLALAVPVIVHLLARRSARVQRFPSVRFLGATPLVSARRTRLTDLLLLAVRAIVVAVAVAALAQPYLLTDERRGASARLLARAIVVDTSASMLRATAAGVRAVDEARTAASTAAAEAATALVIETASPRDALAGAAAWLEGRPGRREIVITSDFQLGVLDASDIRLVPDGVGITLQRIAIDGGDATAERIVTLGAMEQVARATRVDGGTQIEWSTRAGSGLSENDALRLLVDDASAATAAATMSAVLTAGAQPHGDAARPVTLIHSGHPSWDVLLQGARPLDARWMADAAAAIRRDGLLAAAAAQDARDGFDVAPVHTVPIAWTDGGAAAVLAARAAVEDTDGLVLFTHAQPGSLLYAALVHATLRALSPPVPAHELETATLDDATIAAWSRDMPAAPASAATGAESDGRWVWLAVLVLLGFEAWLRRRTRKASTEAAA